MKKILLLIFLNIHLSIVYGADNPNQFIHQITNQQFRNEIISYVKQQTQNSAEVKNNFLTRLDEMLDNVYQPANWTVVVTCYQKGTIVEQGAFKNKDINFSLYGASKAIIRQVKTPEDCTFKIDFSYYPDRHYSFVSYDNTGLELTGNRVAVRKLTKKNMEKQISDSIGYLSRVMHPALHGFYKFYDAQQDKSESELRTIYSASSLFTFIKAQAYFTNSKLQEKFKTIAQFILSQQLQTGDNKGAFYYSYDPVKKQPIKKLAVGTASKTIFTLLLLNELYPEDPTYLHSAKLAGNWLIKQVLDDGRTIPMRVYKKNRWVIKRMDQSLLYSGQVLSALSRLYIVTKDQRYLDKATLIANRFINKVREKGPILGDSYRSANSISSSWVLLSLIDISKADPSLKYLQAIQQIAPALLKRQITNLGDIYYVGKFSDAMTTSGNGWLNEVFGEYYPFCVKKNLGNCDQYKNAMILSSRWLLQNAYRQDNTYDVKNPSKALGGYILNYNNFLIRTDAVCHGTNSLLSLLKIVGKSPQILIDIKEQPLFEILPLIRAGNNKE